MWLAVSLGCSGDGVAPVASERVGVAGAADDRRADIYEFLRENGKSHEYAAAYADAFAYAASTGKSGCGSRGFRQVPSPKRKRWKKRRSPRAERCPETRETTDTAQPAPVPTVEPTAAANHAPTPAPAQPAQPATPYPTLTPVPTPAPRTGPQPPYPTLTPVPTLAPPPTATPYPTSTPYPTATPYPTYTPVPTETPLSGSNFCAAVGRRHKRLCVGVCRRRRPKPTSRRLRPANRSDMPPTMRRRTASTAPRGKSHEEAAANAKAHADANESRLTPAERQPLIYNRHSRGDSRQSEH